MRVGQGLFLCADAAVVECSASENGHGRDFNDEGVCVSEPTGPYDLKKFFRAIGQFSGVRASASTLSEREEPDTPAELLDGAPSEVVSAAMPVSGFVDGVQASLVVCHREHRPVYLSYTAAGCVDPQGRPLGLRERLVVVCSVLDREWVDALDSDIPVEELALSAPPDVERAALTALAGDRESLERALVDDLLAQGTGLLVLDGSLTARPHDSRLVGVVKSMRRKYLADESCLYGLKPGWRSPRFKIASESAGSSADRYSCYLRLFDASDAAWNFGLVRLESYDAAQLDPLCALALQQRQGGGSSDARYDRHLRSVRECEEFLRARRPQVFTL